MSRNDNHAAETQPRGAALTDEAFSNQLGGFQRKQTLYTAVAVAGILGCIAAALLFHELVLAAVLFAVAAAGIALGSGMQKKKKALIRSRLGGEFDAELAQRFGPEPQTPELPIDEAYLRASRLTGRVWEKCSVRNFHEGVYRGVRFSAANAILEHTYQTWHPHDGQVTNTAKMLDGVVIRCRTALRAPARVSVRGRIEPEEPDVIRTASADFDRRFITESESQSAALTLLTPLLLQALTELERNFRDELAGLIWEEDTLTLAFNTQYVFADVPDALDTRDIGDLRKWYTASLNGMCFALDTLMKSTSVLGTHE